MNAYILSCTEKEHGGGIGGYLLTEGGRLVKKAFLPCDRPMYAASGHGRLTVLLRAPFSDTEHGGVFSVNFALTEAHTLQCTNGKIPCHLCVDGSDIYAVNYLSGNLVRVGKAAVTHEGKGVNAARQEMPHTHCAFFSPDKQHVLCCDLGLDTLFCYDRDLHPVSKAKTADGYGIRHAVFSRDGRYIYAISELVPAIHVFSYTDGAVKWLCKLDIPHKSPHADDAAIRLSGDGRYLYASLRRENALAVFSVDGAKIELLQTVDCGGDSPRDFDITNTHLIVTNERSGNVVVFAHENGLIAKKTDEISTPNPLCCVLV